jgi:hypothetical protein
VLCLILQIEACGGQALTFGGDVSKEEDVESMIKTVSKCYLLLLYLLLALRRLSILIFTGG